MNGRTRVSLSSTPPLGGSCATRIIRSKGGELEPYKYIIHKPKLKSGLPIRNGLARLAATMYMLKGFTLKDWWAFAEVFGMPIRVGKYWPQCHPGRDQHPDQRHRQHRQRCRCRNSRKHEAGVYRGGQDQRRRKPLQGDGRLGRQPGEQGGAGVRP